MKGFGTRPTYQIFSVAALVTGCIYYLFNKFYIRKKSTLANDDVYEKKKPLDIECTNHVEKKSIDGVKNADVYLADNADLSTKAIGPIDGLTKKCKSNNVDGSNVVGEDNPVYINTETPSDKK